jgi:hypothetical protein
MSKQDEFLDGDDWSADENAQLGSLARERIPPHRLKGKTIAALHNHGFLAAPASASPRRLITLVAAASVIFIAGALVGYLAARRAPTPDVEPRMANREQVAHAESVTNTQPVRHVVWY